MTEKAELSECPATGTPILYADSEQDNARYIIKARCKMWNCPYCGKVNAHQHWIRILNGCNELLHKRQRLNFITITSHEKLRTTEQCLFVHRKGFQKLKERLRRKVENHGGHKLSYVVIPEFHKDKRLHWHGIVNGNISTRWLKDSARSCGYGYQCKSSKMDNAIQATNYATKYLVKTLHLQDFPKKMHRISYSESFPDRPAPSTDYSWKILDAKESIVDCIQRGWRKDLDTYLNWKEITEILTE